MFLHIGNNYMVRKSEILGIFDMDNATWSKWTRQALSMAERSGGVINAALDEIPNTFLLCQEQNQQKIYLSMLTAATLLKRAEESVF